MCESRTLSDVVWDNVPVINRALTEKAEKPKSVALKCAWQSPREEALAFLLFSAHKETIEW